MKYLQCAALISQVKHNLSMWARTLWNTLIMLVNGVIFKHECRAKTVKKHNTDV